MKKCHRSTITLLWQKKNERTLYSKMRVRSPCLLSNTKLPGKIFFATYSNNLIYRYLNLRAESLVISGKLFD